MGKEVPKVMYSATLLHYAQDLKLYYKKLPLCQTHCRSKFNLVVKRDKISSVRNRNVIYSTPAFESLKQSTVETYPIAYEDILSSPAKCFIIEGEQCIGKTELVWDLCCKWEEIKQLKKYILIILLDLKNKHVQDINTLQDLFDHDDISARQEITQEVCNTKGKNIMIILDGFEQLPQTITKNHESFFVKLIEGNILPKSTKLITGTPKSIQSIVGNYQVMSMRHVEIMGSFSQYTHAETSHPKTVDVQEISRFLKYLPLTSSVVTYVQDQSYANDSIPTTLTEHYISYFMKLLCRYLKKTSNPFTFHDLKAHPSIHKKFLVVSKLALMGIMEKDVHFSDYLAEDPGAHIGMMSASCTHCKDNVLEFRFLNTKLQEFLAANFISHLEDHEQDDFFSLSEMNGVWKFVAGLTGLTRTMLDLFKSYINDPTCLIQIVSLLYELQDEGAIQYVFEGYQVLDYSLRSLKESKDFMSRCYEVGYCVAASASQWKLDFSCCNLEFEDLKAFISGMNSVKNINGSIQSLQLDCNIMTHDKVLLLSELSLQQMTSISLASCNLTQESFDHLASMLMPRLKSLNIGHNSTHCHSLVTKLLSSLTVPTELEELNIEGTALEYADMVHLNTMLSMPGTNLTQLSIGGKTMSLESMHLLIDTILSQSFSIEVLHISDLDLTSDSDTLTFLETNTNLTRIVFFECHLELTNLATSLCMNTTLKELEIFFPLTSEDEDIGPDAAVALSDMLEVNCSLRALSLYSFKCFPPAKVLRLIEPLNYNQTLETLQLPSHFAMRFSPRAMMLIDQRVCWNEWPCIQASVIQ